MRRCDDIADDGALSLRDRQNKLTEWLDKVHRALAGQATDDPVLMALTDGQRSYQIPVGLLDQLAYGTAADLEQSEPQENSQVSQTVEPGVPSPLVARYETFEDLRQYCYGVGSGGGRGGINFFFLRAP